MPEEAEVQGSAQPGTDTGAEKSAYEKLLEDVRQRNRDYSHLQRAHTRTSQDLSTVSAERDGLLKEIGALRAQNEALGRRFETLEGTLSRGDNGDLDGGNSPALYTLRNEIGELKAQISALSSDAPKVKEGLVWALQQLQNNAATSQNQSYEAQVRKVVGQDVHEDIVNDALANMQRGNLEGALATLMAARDGLLDLQRKQQEAARKAQSTLGGAQPTAGTRSQARKPTVDTAALAKQGVPRDELIQRVVSSFFDSGAEEEA